MGDYAYNKDENPIVGSKWNMGSPFKEQNLASLLPTDTGESDSLSSSSYGIGARERYPAEHGHGYKIPIFSPKDDPKPISSKEIKIDWQKLGILTLIKLGLLKFQTIGFKKILFLLVFKFKMYMVAVFLKFLLIMKLMKLLKILILPFFIIQLFPTLVQLLKMKLTNLPTTQDITQLNRPGSLRPGVISGGSPSTFIPGGTTGGGGFSSGVSSTLLPGGTTTTFIPGGTSSTLIPGTTTNNRFPDSAIPGTFTNNRFPGTGLSSFKLDDQINIQKERLELLDPALDIFQKLLDSEKCIERIACRIAVAEFSGVIPFWINW